MAALHPFTKLSNRLLRPPWRSPLHSGQEQGWRAASSSPASRAMHHTHCGENRDLLMAQMRHGALWPHCRPSSHHLLRPPGPLLSLPKIVIFTVTAAHFLGAPFPQGCGASPASHYCFFFFAVLVSIVVGGDWVSHSSPRSEMLGLSVCPSSKLLSEGRKGLNGRAEPEPRQKILAQAPG